MKQEKETQNVDRTIRVLFTFVIDPSWHRLLIDM